jgi:hypothetical protein
VKRLQVTVVSANKVISSVDPSTGGEHRPGPAGRSMLVSVHCSGHVPRTVSISISLMNSTWPPSVTLLLSETCLIVSLKEVLVPPK